MPEDSKEDGQQEQTGGTGGDDGQQQGTTDQGTNTGTTDADQSAAQDVASLPAWAQKALQQARQEAGASRANAKKTAAEEARASVLAELGKALGFTKDETPDPEALKKDLESRNSALATARRELAVVRSAGSAQADAEALLDSRAFMSKVEKIDAGADDFAQQVNDLIAAEVKANAARFKVTPAGKSAGEIGGSGNGSARSDDDWAAIEKRVRESRSRR